MSWTFGRFRHFRWPKVAKGHRAKRKQARSSEDSAMKRLLLLCVLSSVLAGCAITDEERIDEASEFCGFRGYNYLRIYREYGEIDAIYCSLGDDVLSAPYTNPLENLDVPHE